MSILFKTGNFQFKLQLNIENISVQHNIYDLVLPKLVIGLLALSLKIYVSSLILSIITQHVSIYINDDQPFMTQKQNRLNLKH